MKKKAQSLLLLFLLLLPSFQTNITKEQSENQNWQLQKNYFHYSINVVETLSNEQSIGFQVDMLFLYLGLQSNNEAIFKIQVYSTLANYAGTETATGYENIQSRLMNVNLTNSIYIQRVLSYLGFTSNEIYNPFVIPIEAIQYHQNVLIWTYNHTFIESSHYQWFGTTRNVSIYQFKNNRVSDSGYYDNEYGILFFAKFTIQSSLAMFNASIKLIGTSLQLLHGTVPLINYILAVGLCLAIPGIIIIIYYSKKYKSKKLDSGGLK